MTDRQTVSTEDYQKLKAENEELRQYLNELETSHAVETRYRQNLEERLIQLAQLIQAKEKPLF